MIAISVCTWERPTGGWAHLDISPVDTKIPLHNRMISPVKATAIKSLVRVRNINTAFHGGSLARADFQLTPPFGSIMVNLGRREVEGKRRRAPQRGGTIERVSPASNFSNLTSVRSAQTKRRKQVGPGVASTRSWRIERVLQ
jgi:hypothetical protein